MSDQRPVLSSYADQTIGQHHDEPPRLSMHEAALRWIQEVYELNSRSQKTVTAYKSILAKFDLYLREHHLQLDSEPRTVALKIQEWVPQPDPAGRRKQATLAPGSINQRYAALSSFYEFAVRFGACEINPVTYCKRPKRQVIYAAPALNEQYVEEKLALIDATTREGVRDLAFLTLGLMTGRRLSELARLQWKDVSIRGETMHIIWRHCKGGKVLKDDLALRTAGVIFDYLHREFGPALETITPESYIFRSHSNRNRDGRLAPSAISKICEDRLGFSQSHVLRHTNAVNRELAGFTLVEIGDLLGHSNYSTTADYLKSKREQVHTDKTTKLESMFGINKLGER